MVHVLRGLEWLLQLCLGVGNALEHIPASYTRYLERYFLEAFKLQGTPLRIQYKTSKNPFAVEGRPTKDKLRREK